MPSTWSGLWSNQQQAKEHLQTSFAENNYIFNSATVSSTNHAQNSNTRFKTIDETSFLNKGKCLNNKDERYFFYDK